MLLTGVNERVTTSSVGQAQVDQPIQVPGVAPVLIEKFEEGDLGNTARVLRGDLEVTSVALDDLLGGDNPANPGTGGNNLREGLETNDTAISVHAQERGDK